MIRANEALLYEVDAVRVVFRTNDILSFTKLKASPLFEEGLEGRINERRNGRTHNVNPRTFGLS
jgi:hypothetical protein